jgi:hypothetical protein
LRKENRNRHARGKRERGKNPPELNNLSANKRISPFIEENIN